MDITSVNLTDHQKMVLLVIQTADSPASAYNDMASNEKAVKAVDLLTSIEAIEKDDEARTLELTTAGRELMTNEKLISNDGAVTSYGTELLNKFVSESFSLINELNTLAEQTL